MQAFTRHFDSIRPADYSNHASLQSSFNLDQPQTLEIEGMCPHRIILNLPVRAEGARTLFRDILLGDLHSNQSMKALAAGGWMITLADESESGSMA